MRRLQLTFQLLPTEEKAKQFVEITKRVSTPYCNKKYPPHYSEWTSSNGKEHAFIVWYRY